MRTLLTKLLCFAAASTALPTFAADPAPNGIALPEGYKNWQLLSVHQRSDNNTLRAVLGNDIAIKAARAGKTDPWPDGSIIGKLVWKAVKHDHWETALEPGAFVHAEFMVKDRDYVFPHPVALP